MTGYTSFYDQFDSPDVMRALLGTMPSGAGPAPPPPPPPPQQGSMPHPPMTVMDPTAGPGPSFANMTMPSPAMPPRGIGSDAVAAPPGPPPGFPGSMMNAGGMTGAGAGPPAPPPPGAGPSLADIAGGPVDAPGAGIGSDYAAGAPAGAGPGTGGIGSDAVAGGMPPGIPLPPPGAVGGIGSDARFPAGAPGAPARTTDASAARVGPSPPARPPIPLQPPGPAGMPPPGFGSGLPAMPTPTGARPVPGGNDRVFGLFDRASLAAGLKAAGANAHKGAGAAFLGSAGAALEGGDKSAQTRFDQDFKVRKQAFDESSTAFRNMITAAQEKNSEGYRQAQIKYLEERAKALATGKQSNAWQNTPYGQMIGIEREARERYKAREVTLRQTAKEQAWPEQKLKDELATLDQQREGYAQRLYASKGINPGSVNQLKTMGQSADNPFAPKNAHELHSMVPEGGWFKDPVSGKVLRFTKPQWDKFGPQHSSDNAAPNNDDLTAMSGGQPAAAGE